MSRGPRFPVIAVAPLHIGAVPRGPQNPWHVKQAPPTALSVGPTGRNAAQVGADPLLQRVAPLLVLALLLLSMWRAQRFGEALARDPSLHPGLSRILSETSSTLMFGSPADVRVGPLEFGPTAWSNGSQGPSGPIAVDPAVRARGLQTHRLAEARAAFAAGEADSLNRAETLWVEARDPNIREAALSLVLDHARADLPRDYRGRFLLGLAPAVIRAGRTHKVPPSVTLGQAIIESGWGRSRMARVDHNLFGVKGGGRTVRSREFRNGRWTTIHAAYRRYPDVDAAIAHHAELMNGRHFRFARPLWTDWDAYLRAIAPKYASSPRYVSHVSSMVRLYDLHRWDALVARAAAWDAAHPRPDAIVGQLPAQHPSQG
jgi:hypothetical protein